MRAGCIFQAGLNIEVCGAVQAQALDDGAVRCGCGPLHCGAVRSLAKLLGPQGSSVYMYMGYFKIVEQFGVSNLANFKFAHIFSCMV